MRASDAVPNLPVAGWERGRPDDLRGGAADDAPTWWSDQVTAEVPATGDRAGDPFVVPSTDLTVVMGAVGGCGVTTIACALALAIRERGPTLLDLDLDDGDAHEGWAVRETRSIGDLVAVQGELRREHIDRIAHRHESGIDLVLSPATPGSADRWDGPSTLDLLARCLERGPVVVDCGRACRTLRLAACHAAGRVLVAAPPTLRAAARVRRIVDEIAGDRVVLAVPRLGRSDELTARAFRGACAVGRSVELPNAPGEATVLRSGRVPVARRRLWRRLGDLFDA